MAWVWFHRFGSPPYFYRVARRLTPWFAWSALVLGLAGLVWGLAFTPPEAHQGYGFRIIYLHVPAAWLSLQVYVVMALAAAVGLIWRMKVAHAVAASCATVGTSFTVIALGTGMLWGKPMWGTFWAWDPRLTSELLLLFLYLGYIGLRSGFDDTARADRASAVLAIVGVVDVPIVKYSVDWWNSLHQGSSIIRAGGPAIATPMLIPLLIMILAFYLYFAAVLLVRARSEILRRERNAQWIAEELAAPDAAAGSGNGSGAVAGGFQGVTAVPHAHGPAGHARI